MPLLYFWRGDNYRRDLDLGAGFHLNQSNPLLHHIERGDSVWAFTRRPDGRYALAADLVVAAKTRNPTGYRYGPYRVWGDLRRSRYFATTPQPDVTELIRGLSVPTAGDVLGRAFQGRAAVRQLTDADHRILQEFARRIPAEPRARLVPEERLEALLLAGDEDAVEALIRAEPAGLAEERRQYLIHEAPRRDRSLVGELRRLYEGRCQLCGWEPRLKYRVELCEAHHVRWLSRGGDDAIDNLVLICPNHHRAIHECDAPFDHERTAFVFPTTFEPLTLRLHRLAAN